MASAQHPLDRLDVSSRVLKRAQYEALAFVIRPSYVDVRNHSYADPEAHTYRVRIADGIPVNCTCPADMEYERACKHRVGVAIRSKILDMAIAMTTAADGRDDTHRERREGGATAPATVPDAADCDCQPDGGRPRWPCVTTDRLALAVGDRAGDDA
ncbi:SWIM zinc finger family protein [Haloplanus sp. C73]|uniref:SWIM zinc finger family protein n=1 Tax=Haloplanus sp. C73 TaxID=3421641 RepID=UPI003EBF57AE